MTPLTVFYSTILPPRLVPIALFITYAGLLFVTLAFSGYTRPAPLVYLDI